MRKAYGTPFKLRSTPFKENGKADLPSPDYSGDPIVEDLGVMVGDDNHLKQVNKETTKGAKVEKLATTPEEIAAYKKYLADVESGKIKRNTKYDDKVDYKIKDIPTPPKPGGPGDKVDPFKPDEYRGQVRTGKIAGNKAVQASNKANRANNKLAKFKKRKSDDDGNFIEPKPGDKGYKKYMRLKNTSDIRNEQSDAQRESSRNRFDQLKQGRNAYRSGEQVKYRYDMSKGSEGAEGSDFTVASDEDLKNYRRVSDIPDYSGKKAGIGYGRKRSATPFKLKRYK